MSERDEEGRPVATRNAGAFLAPLMGVPPVPSSAIDQRGASVEHVAEADLERSPRRPMVDADRARASSVGARWAWSVSLATAITVLLACCLQPVLDGTRGWASTPGPTSGTHLLSLVQSDGAALAASLAFVAVGVAVGIRSLPARDLRLSLALVVATVACASVIVWVAAQTPGGPIVVILSALVWLGFASQSRQT